MAADTSHGTLNRDDRLPPQRALAAAIGVDCSTISRGYADAQRRGLIDARVGRGTFARHLRDRAPTPSSNASTDFMVNSPPNVSEGEARNTLWNEVSRAAVALDPIAFMRHQPPGRNDPRPRRWRAMAPAAPERGTGESRIDSLRTTTSVGDDVQTGSATRSPRS
ncbi:GntR family transcriptional regulator (plasmid) [Paraburkholderia strydomiana]